MLTTTALTLLWPVMVVVAILVRVRLGSPVLFRQKRPGLYGRAFHLLKFRTMTNATDKEGRPLPDYLRLTHLGRFLRSTSLDELPSLLNVLKGELSLVGPRPLLMTYISLYSAEQGRRHDVKPGLTGWAQIKGRNSISWEQKFEFDTWYVDNRSMWLDAKIVFLTIKKVIFREGISGPGEATMSEFTGSLQDKASTDD